jgi:coenzyme F420-0:L-glutamate ligase/coenzyme F420-1:gamma-L-glutamate ligase
MLVKEAILQRRSVRKFLPTKIADEIVLDVLKDAGWAPSAHNAQPWRFVVIKDAVVKRELSVAMAKVWVADLKKDGQTVNADMHEERVERFANAPVLVLACSTMEGLRKFPDEQRQICERDLAMQSLGAAMQNLLLSVHATGLGACWFCAPAFCKEAVRKVLKIPDAVEPEAFVLMGYPDETPSVPKKKLPEEYCFVDVWGRKS